MVVYESMDDSYPFGHRQSNVNKAAISSCTADITASTLWTTLDTSTLGGLVGAASSLALSIWHFLGAWGI